MNSGRDYRVQPRRWAAIGVIADDWRAKLGISRVEHLPIVPLVEKVLSGRLKLFDFHVLDAEEMGGDEGQTCPNGTFIAIRQDVYYAALRDQPRARFTFAHELGHWVLHSGLPLARTRRNEDVPAYCRAEPQANQFAARFMMPASLIAPWDTPETLMQRFGVSHTAAKNRLEAISKEGA